MWSQVCSCHSPKNEWWIEPFQGGKCRPGPLAWPRREKSPRPGGADPALALDSFLQFMPLLSLLFSPFCFPRIFDAFSFWAHASSITEIFCSISLMLLISCDPRFFPEMCFSEPAAVCLNLGMKQARVLLSLVQTASPPDWLPSAVGPHLAFLAGSFLLLEHPPTHQWP